MRRETVQRRALRAVFQRHDAPLGIMEILDLGRGIVPSLNIATVYRNVNAMIEEGLLRRVNHPALGTLYERTGKGHHHHFHCHSCDRIYELPGCSLKEGAVAPEGFVVEEHEVFLAGVCPECGSAGET